MESGVIRVALVAMATAVLAACTGPNFGLTSFLPQGGRVFPTPTNIPPSSFVGDFWIDSMGCEFVRTGSGRWVPRIGTDGNAFCNADNSYDLADLAPLPGASNAPELAPGTIVDVDESTGTVTRIAPVQPIPPSFVDIGTFADQAAGLAARRQFAGLGFPIVGSDQTPPPGAALSVVLGPFTDQGALEDGLRMAQSLGYANASTFQN